VRKILDGILIANEVVDEARHFKKEILFFKVDFEKANDSVDWHYLDAIMNKMNFPTLWRKWILECIDSATASMLVNGCHTDEFSLERGLRQGDHLSPFFSVSGRRFECFYEIGGGSRFIMWVPCRGVKMRCKYHTSNLLMIL